MHRMILLMVYIDQISNQFSLQLRKILKYNNEIYRQTLKQNKLAVEKVSIYISLNHGRKLQSKTPLEIFFYIFSS